MDRTDALARISDLVHIAVEAGADEEEILRAVQAGIASAERSRPRGGDAYAEYRARYGRAA